MKESTFDPKVHRFLLDDVDSVPQIEALLLLWESRPRQWSVDELACRLYIEPARVPAIVEPLAHRQLIVYRRDAAVYSYEPRTAAAEQLIAAVAGAYRADLVGATTIIHSKASAGVREFARAFKFKKDQS